MNILEPNSLEVDDSTHTLEIAWNDGHTTRHGLEALRRLCPCAECKGEWDVPGNMTAERPLTAEQVELADLYPVGRYALTPRWADGHSTGIYPYEYLRKNCECPACVAKRAAQ
jgi:DUF971 family protein